MDIRTVTVIGAGIMGHGIAEVCAIAGLPVTIEDAFPDALKRAEASIKGSLDRMKKSGKIDDKSYSAILSRISFSSSLQDAVRNADIIIEAVPEIPDLKISVIRDITASCRPDAIVASNTSNIRISTLAENASNPQRVLGLHFFNPPVVMKLVEVIKSEKTSQEAFDSAFEFSKFIGKTPIKVLKDSPGFVVNRINAPESLLFCLVLDRGMAKPEELDAFAKSQGLPMGPYELMDYVGIDTVVHSLDYYAETLDKEYGKCKYFRNFMDKGNLGLKTGKGFYTWENGHAKIPDAKPSSVLELLDILAVEINEAVKIIEEGVAGPADIETGVKLGMNRPFGPISVAEGLTNAEIKRKLIALSQKFDTRIFYPAKSIEEGKLREVISGKSMKRTDQETSLKPEAKPADTDAVVRLERDERTRVAHLVLRNTRNNLINQNVLESLEKYLKQLWNDREINVIVVRGEGENLSAGAQLTQFFSGPMDFAENARLGERTFRLFSEIPKITIAEMKGYILGGGFELSIWCDIRVATPDATIGFPETTLGLIPGWGGSQRLSKLVGMSRASYLILTGERFTGKYANEIGLVSRLFDKAEIASETDRFAADLAARIAPVSAAMAKKLIYKGSEMGTDNGLEMESIAMGLLYGTDDLKEGISAFLQKRKPDYKGR
ncbi:MAG: 3-hydroxyacyl-CoA dehydrogenase/enoyl-CoA hydratase family protein [Candidatus Thermoplasmatota archaeon]|nr:3-hydroxyacyl-CoA dehydrogenase/enoyl-CoA hydratase family protein [Candidatus Thermoplasmatota archaeon]